MIEKMDLGYSLNPCMHLNWSKLISLSTLLRALKLISSIFNYKMENKTTKIVLNQKIGICITSFCIVKENGLRLTSPRKEKRTMTMRMKMI